MTPETEFDVNDWIDKRIPIGKDEHLILKIYRTCKTHYEFILGIIIGMVLTYLALK